MKRNTSRRTVLAACGAVLTGFAGCSSSGATTETPSGDESDPVAYPDSDTAVGDVFVSSYSGTFAYTPTAVWTLETMPTSRFITASPPSDWPDFQYVQDVQLVDDRQLAVVTFTVANVGETATPPPGIPSRFGVVAGSGAVRQASGEAAVVPVSTPDVSAYDVNVGNLVDEPGAYPLHSFVRTPDKEPLSPGSTSSGWVAVPVPSDVEPADIRPAMGAKTDGAVSFPVRWSSGYTIGGQPPDSDENR